MTKVANNYVNFDEVLDPAVDAMLGEAKERRDALKLTPEERRKIRLRRERERKRKAAEKVKIRERRGKRVTYDLPPDLRAQVSELANERSIPASQLAAWLLTRALEHFGGTAEALAQELFPYLSPSRSPRYAWNLYRFLEEGEEF
jgi:hypothetical protein